MTGLSALLLLAALFPATAAKAADLVTGTIVAGGVTCPLLRASDGRTIALVDLPRPLQTPGTTLSLSGSYMQSSSCMQGDASFRVEKVLKP